MSEINKKKNLAEILGKNGIYLAGNYFASAKKERCRYPDIVEVVRGAERITNEAGEIVYRKLEVPLVEEDAESDTALEYRLAGKRYLPYLNPVVIGKLCGLQQPVAVEKMLFIDLETTGLAGGTGTYPILIGVGYWRESEFVLEQFFMEDFDREPASLVELARRLPQFSAFITYNGKAFDIPILRTRFVLHRLAADWDKPNLDLLPLVRRLWRGVLPECSLHIVEKELLNISRQRDVDGSMVPQIYFDFLRRRDPTSMAVVFDHNAQDVVSLASLLLRLCYYYQYPEDEEIAEALLQLGLSKIYERNRDLELCVQSMERALVYSRDPRLSFHIATHLARLYKRLGRWEESVEIWKMQIERGKLYNLEPFIELAKYYEHRQRDHQQAYRIVMQAIHYVDDRQELSQLLGDWLNFDPEQAINELTHRLRRLQRRLWSSFEQNLIQEEQNED